VWLARYFKTPFEAGELESSRWSEISRKSRDPISLVILKRFSNAELVIASKWAMPVMTTCGLSFFISSMRRSDRCGASITVRSSASFLVER
jgi:hypothetical protein